MNWALLLRTYAPFGKAVFVSLIAFALTFTVALVVLPWFVIIAIEWLRPTTGTASGIGVELKGWAKGVCLPLGLIAQVLAFLWGLRHFSSNWR